MKPHIDLAVRRMVATKVPKVTSWLIDWVVIGVGMGIQFRFKSFAQVILSHTQSNIILHHNTQTALALKIFDDCVRVGLF